MLLTKVIYIGIYRAPSDSSSVFQVKWMYCNNFEENLTIQQDLAFYNPCYAHILDSILSS